MDSQEPWVFAFEGSPSFFNSFFSNYCQALVGSLIENFAVKKWERDFFFLTQTIQSQAGTRKRARKVCAANDKINRERISIRNYKDEFIGRINLIWHVKGGCRRATRKISDIDFPGHNHVYRQSIDSIV